jgi:hypothetical protein
MSRKYIKNNKMTSFNEIDKKARQVALNLQSLMAIVEFDYNRYEKCMVCNEKYKHHIDGLPCETDTVKKEIIKRR